ncbi:MAG TPA: hypothetical protein VH723_00410 [Candidatus Limnocylindrales bacterium]
MDQIRFVETAYRMEHRHKDGSWASMEEIREPHHQVPEHDQERGWIRGRIFKCRTCDESVTIVPGTEWSPSRDGSRG